MKISHTLRCSSFSAKSHVCEGVYVRILEHIGVDTKLPKTEVLKKLFTPGEIDDIYLEISKLSGYTKNTLEEIKKK